MKSKSYSRPCRRPSRTENARALVLAAVFLACASTASAGVPDWLRALARTPLPAYPEDTKAVILLDEQETTVNDSGEIKTLYRKAVKILRPGGRDYGTVVVNFDNETRLTYLKAWSVSAQSAEYEVKEKDAVETSLLAFGLYDDTRHKILSIPASEPGSVIGYEYEQRRRPFVLQDMWDFQDEIPVRRARFTLRLPTGWEYETVWLNHAGQNSQKIGENQWAWELETLPAIEPEPAMPAWRSLAGRMGVIYHPRQRDPGGRSHASWQEVGQWYAQLVGSRREATPEIRQKVAELTAQSKTTLEKIKALASFAQSDIRYVAIEIGIGGYQPHPAQEIFTNRYGDCKDKVTILSTMLREVGIQSYYVLTHSRRGTVAPKFPSMLNFNHVILAIRLPEDVPTVSLYAVWQHEKLGQILFFDPTDPLTPLGYLPPNLQANFGLMVTEESGELVELPLLPPSVNRLLRVAQLNLDTTGALSGNVEEIRWGTPAKDTRARLMDTPEAERHKALEAFLGAFLGSLVFRGSEVENLEKINESLVVRYSFLAKDYAKTAGDLVLIRPRVLGQKSSDLLEKKERKYPVEFPGATLETDFVEITLPSGFRVEELPPPLEISCGFAEYKSQVEAAGNVLRYRRNYTVKDVLVPTGRLEELKKFYRQIAADERNSAVLKRVAAEPAAPASEKPKLPTH